MICASCRDGQPDDCDDPQHLRDHPSCACQPCPCPVDRTRDSTEAGASNSTSSRTSKGGRPIGRSHRLPAAPARRAITIWAESHRFELQDLAEGLHLQMQELRLLLERRWLTWETADEIAVALGRHPFEIWPEWFDTFCRPAGAGGPGKGEVEDGRHPDSELPEMSSSGLTQRRRSTRSKEGQR